MSGFVDYALFLLKNQAGCDVFVSNKGKDEKKPKKTVTTAATEGLMRMTNRGSDALGHRVGVKEFFVRVGSKVAADITESFKDHPYYGTRQELIKDGTIADGVFTKDYTFRSISEAASVVAGASTNGLTSWKEV